MPCLNEESLNMLDKYKMPYKEDSFAEDTITAGKQLIASMTQERQRKWLNTIESTDMSRNSKKAWNLIRKLNNNPAVPKHQHYPVTANQVAHQLLVNHFATGDVQGVSQRYSPPLELNPKGLGKKQKYCYKLY